MNTFVMPNMALPTMPSASRGMLPMAATGPVMVPAIGARPASVGMPMPASSSQAMLGAEAVKPPSTLGTVLKGMLTMGGIGAAIGAGATFLPFIPGAPLVGAAIGAAAGALVGIFSGVRKARRQQDEMRALMMGSLQPAPDPSRLGPEIHVKKTSVSTRKAKKKRHARHAAVVVRRGDTLGAIARRSGVSVDQLHTANRAVIGANPNIIHPGMRLVIPSSS